MRNLKKFLALVLAMMMVFSLMITVNAASSFNGYTDAGSISDRYKTAVEVLTNIGVFHGTNNGSTFSPNETITRAEMATIIYRVMTGDVRDRYIDLYKGYDNDFEDVTDEWFAPYVNYANNAGIVVGDGNGHFYPMRKINGYQVLAILLRALGYDQPGEFTGKNWDMHTAQIAAQLHITDNLAYTLSTDTPRQVVAQMTYNTAVKTERRAWTPYLSYQPTGESLIDMGTSYTQDDVWGIETTYTNFEFTYPDVDVPGIYAEEAKPLKVYYSPVTQCDVSEDTKIDDTTLDTYTNGIGNKDSQVILDSNTTDLIGAQGRETRVYADRIVYRDVVLAKGGSISYGYVDTGDHPISDPVVTGATVYGNVGMEGVAAAPTGKALGNATNSTGNGGYFVEGNYSGSWLQANVLTWTTNNTLDAASTLPYNPATGAAYASANACPPRVQNESVITATQVTVNAIKRGANQTIEGFIGTNGVTYLYSIAFGYNTAPATETVAIDAATTNTGVQVLATTAIGKTYNVYVYNAPDGSHNVLGITPTTSAETAKYGVVTGQKSVTVENPNSIADVWAIEYTVLLSNNTTATFKALNSDNEPYNSTELAAASGVDFLRHLVKIDANTTAAGKGFTGYYTLSDTTNDIAPTAPAANPTVYVGDADTLNGGGVLVDDDTVFFVANYTMTNANSNPIAYSFTNYTIYNGFKNLPGDLAFGANTGVYENGAPIPSYSSDAVGVDKAVGSLDVYAFAGGIPVAANSGVYADYVLILNATERTPITQRAQTVPSYAYVKYNADAHDIYNDYWQFNILSNGSATTLRVNSQSGSAINQSGLYIYKPADSTNGLNAFDPTTVVNHVASAANAWDYTAPGVLKVATALTAVNDTLAANLTAGWNDQYLTVVDNVPIYIVNEATGRVVKTTYDLDELLEIYTDSATNATPEIYFQTNAYGWISLIYMVDKNTGTSGATSSALTNLSVPNAASTAPTAGAYFSSITYSPTTTDTDPGSGAITVTVDNVVWQWLNPATGAYENVPAGATSFVAGRSYRAVLTLSFAGADGSTDYYIPASLKSGTDWTRAGNNSVYTEPFVVAYPT